VPGPRRPVRRLGPVMRAGPAARSRRRRRRAPRSLSPWPAW
jgi:hypothetical protein